MSNTTPPGSEPAFPGNDGCLPGGSTAYLGLTKREWFAGMAILMPITETQDVSRCDDQDLLERFGTEDEKERGFIPVSGQKMFIWNIELRASLESRARAILRYAEADAMVAAGEAKQ